MIFLSSTYQQEFNSIIHDIQTAVESPLIAKVIGQPRIPRLALALQYLFLKEQNYTAKQVRVYCTSTSLVQMSLNIHDEVSADDDEVTPKPNQDRERQMQVLAGDLYSGKFYQILSHWGEMEIIHFLAEAVRFINQAKTNLYGLLARNELTLKQYEQETEKISTALLKAWLEHERTTNSLKWNTVVSNLLTAEKLMFDANRSLPPKCQSSVLTQLKHRAGQLIAQSRHSIQDWGPSQETKRELERLIDFFFPGTAGLVKTAEEC